MHSASRSQAWSLSNAFGALACAVPGALLRAPAAGGYARIEFPSYLGNYSRARKVRSALGRLATASALLTSAKNARFRCGQGARLVGELHARMRASISANPDDVALDYVPALVGPLTRELETHGRDGIEVFFFVCLCLCGSELYLSVLV